MENLKIRVNSADESKEAQELFLGLGYVKDNWIWSGYSDYPIELRTRDGGYSDFSLNAGNAIERQEITLPELREMANQDQDEPFLTPECTLNDQYAEIEQVRQVEIHGTAKAEPDFNFGAAQAIKVKSGSDSDHMADAMSFGLMGVGAASGGAAQASGGVDATLSQRQSQYGCYEDVAHVTQQILSALRVGNYDELPAPMKESLHMIASKMARIVNGDPEYLDNWHDIGGYAKLIEKLIEGN